MLKLRLQIKTLFLLHSFIYNATRFQRNRLYATTKKMQVQEVIIAHLIVSILLDEE